MQSMCIADMTVASRKSPHYVNQASTHKIMINAASVPSYASFASRPTLTSSQCLDEPKIPVGISGTNVTVTDQGLATSC